MVKIIFTSRYFRNPKGSNLGKLVKYMGTREGVEKLPDGEDHSPATVRQQRLINQITKTFPETKNYLEYEDYQTEQSKYFATEFIDAVIERNADRVEDSKKLVQYMAERPGVEKLGSHGLFSFDDEKIDLDSVADEVSNHDGLVWTHVVSLKREDAERLGYNNANTWKSLLQRNIFDIAQAHKIKPSNLKMYAAFHDTTHHPHIHLLVYSQDVKEGYLTNKGIENLRSRFGNDIFRNEQFKLFQEETHQRDEVKSLLRQMLEDKGYHFNSTPELQNMFVELSEKLSSIEGKKQYGYLPKDIKSLVDEILVELFKDDKLSEMYEKWNDINREKLSLYYDAKKKPDIPIEDNKEFRSLKNMIIKFAKEYGEAEHKEYVSKNFASDYAFTNIAKAFFKLFESSYQKKSNKLNSKIDSKLREKINEKKLAQGLKINVSFADDEDEEEYFGLSM